MRFAPAVVVAALVLVALPACKKPKAGDTCTGNTASCTDPTSALMCSSGTLKALACRGANGCKTANNMVTCDNSVAQANDACDEEKDVACQVDKKAALECKGGVFVLGEPCRGPKGCAVNGDKIQCDHDVADVDDACHFEGNYACSADGKVALRCISHKMKAISTCRGAKGCKATETAPDKLEFNCDNSVAQVGDVCDTAGNYACTPDKQSILKCTGNKFALEKACGGPKGCSFDEKGEAYECDSEAGHADAKAATPTAAPAKKTPAPAKKK